MRKGHDDTAKNSQAGCERTKQDRKDNADFQTAQKTYINKVVLAQSVKADVKAAAKEAIKTFDRTSANLTKRSMIDCHAAFPKGGILP
jgi:ribosomal protein S20